MSTTVEVSAATAVTPWTPTSSSLQAPDIFRKDMLFRPGNFEVLALGGMGYVYTYEGFAYKQNCFQRESDMMRKAGDCAVTAVARVMEVISGRVVMTGVLMERLSPLDIEKVQPSERPAIKDEMTRVVNKLHKEYRMVHGDLKPQNMLRRSDGTLCLCDFDTARPIDEDPQAWEVGLFTEQYLAPNRNYYSTSSPPVPSDDLYALGLSIWELYTGRQALIDELDDIEKVLEERRTVDLMEVKDLEVRSLIRGLLRQGGALV